MLYFTLCLPGHSTGQHAGEPGIQHSWAGPQWWARSKAEPGSRLQAGARLSGAHGWAGQGCGEQETGLAVASLRQGLMAPGAWHGILGYGQVGGAPESRDSQRWWCSHGCGTNCFLQGFLRRPKKHASASRARAVIWLRRGWGAGQLLSRAVPWQVSQSPACRPQVFLGLCDS